MNYKICIVFMCRVLHLIHTLSVIRTRLDVLFRNIVLIIYKY